MIKSYIRTILLMASLLVLPSQLWAEAQPWAEYLSSSHELIFHYDELKAESRATATYDLPTTNKTPGWYGYRTDIQKVTFLSSFAQARPVTCYGWFSGMSDLTDIEGLAYLNTSEVISMNRMFSGCTKLTSLDLYTFDTQRVTDMQAMFAGCTALTDVHLTSLTTNNVTTMWEMFYNCSSLTTLDLTTFYPVRMKDMKMMFAGCKLLEQISVSDAFVLPDDCSGDNMFSGCVKLEGYTSESVGKDKATSISSGGYLSVIQSIPWVGYNPATGTLTFHYDTQSKTTSDHVFELPAVGSVPGWNNVASEVKQVVFHPLFVRYAPTTCYKWMADMSGITSVSGIEYLQTSAVTSMREMFSGCKQLTSLDLSGFNTPIVYDMSSMFNGCAALTSLDLSGFNTAKVVDMSYMFNGCAALTSLDLSGFNTVKVVDMSYMFKGCMKLPSIDLTSFVVPNVTVADEMFNGDLWLTHIYVSEAFAFDAACVGKGMFQMCLSLPHYIATELDIDRAHYKKDGCLTLRRQFSVGDTLYNADGYEDETTCYDNVTFTDGEPYASAFAFTFDTDNTASYTRTISNHWATLCLPFAFSADDNTSARFYSVASYTADHISVTPLTGTIAAGTPVLAYVTDGELSVSATGAAAVAEAKLLTELKGAFAQTEVNNNDYIIANDHFWNVGYLKKQKPATKNVYVAPYRAYLTLHLSSTEAKPNSINIADPTGVSDSLRRIEDTDPSTFLDGAELYDLQGHRLSAPIDGMMIVRKGGVSRKVAPRGR